MQKLRQLDIPDIMSKLYDIFDMTLVDKCGPYVMAPASIGVHYNEPRLKVHCWEDYIRKDGERAHIKSYVTSYCFDENKHDETLQLYYVFATLYSKLYPGKLTVQRFLDTVKEHVNDWDEDEKKKTIKYYDNIFSNVGGDQPYFKGKYVLFQSAFQHSIRQAQLISTFRETMMGLLRLPYHKYLTTTIPMQNVLPSFEHTGYMNFTIMDEIKEPCRSVLNVNDLAHLDKRWEKRFIEAKELDEKGVKHNINVEQYYRQREATIADWTFEERRHVLFEIFQDDKAVPPSVDIEEFEKISSLITDYGMKIDVRYLGKGPKENIRDASLHQLEDVLNVG
jgi:hypothetical protein